MPDLQSNIIINQTTIEYNSTLGRYLVATNSTRARDVLIEELPMVIGPKCNNHTVCLECYKPLGGKFEESRCPFCHWPLCGACIEEGATYHRRFECTVFKKSKQKFFAFVADTGCPQMDCITPLRVLLAKEADPDRWEREVAPMEYHDEERRAMTEVWNADRINIAQYLRGPCQLGQRFSEDLIMQVVGILEVNAFEARTPEGYPLRCLYPNTGVLAHNCVPNTARSIYPSEGYKVRLRAMCDLKAGQQLQHSYTFTLNGTAQRQEHLKAGKFFTCECERCKDPTELSTHFSTFKCTMCESGWLLPENPLDADGKWLCTNSKCTFQLSNDDIKRAVSAMQSEVEALQAIENGGKRLEEAEKLLRKYASILHPSHFINTGLRQSLIEMYGRVEGYEMVSLPETLLQRKEELCRDVLGVLNVFEPGLSRARALMLYELHVPMVLQAKSAFISGALSSEQLREKLQEVIQVLQECVEILQHEDNASQEGVLGRIAQQAKEQLTISVEGLSNLTKE